MNEERRKALRWAMTQINNARAVIEQVKEIEEAAYDNLPESFQNGAAGDKAQEAISTMDDAITDLENVDLVLSEAFGEPTGYEKAPQTLNLGA